MKYSEQRRQGSGDEPALSPSLSGGLYFWNQPTSSSPD